MRAHPAAPLTDANAIYYKAIERARRKLRKAQTIDERIAARNAIGEATAQILRLRRKEQAKMSNPIDSKLVIQYVGEDGEWKKLSEYGLNDIQTAYKVYNQLVGASNLDVYRLVNVKVDLLATNNPEGK